MTSEFYSYMSWERGTHMVVIEINASSLFGCVQFLREFDQGSYLIAPLLVLGFFLSPKKLPNRGIAFFPADSER